MFIKVMLVYHYIDENIFIKNPARKPNIHLIQSDTMEYINIANPTSTLIKPYAVWKSFIANDIKPTPIVSCLESKDCIQTTKKINGMNNIRFVPPKRFQMFPNPVSPPTAIDVPFAKIALVPSKSDITTATILRIKFTIITIQPNKNTEKLKNATANDEIKIIIMVIDDTNQLVAPPKAANIFQIAVTPPVIPKRSNTD